MCNKAISTFLIETQTDTTKLIERKWKLMRTDVRCGSIKGTYNEQQTLDDCIQYCEEIQTSTLVYRSKYKPCACCQDPPGAISSYPDFNMYSSKQGKLFRQPNKTYLSICNFIKEAITYPFIVHRLLFKLPFRRRNNDDNNCWNNNDYCYYERY